MREAFKKLFFSYVFLLFYFTFQLPFQLLQAYNDPVCSAC